MKLQNFVNIYHAEAVSSRSNGTIVSLAKLSNKKYRDEERLFLCEGTKLTEEALRQADVSQLILSESAIERERDSVFALVHSALERGVPILALSDPAFEKLSTEKSPEGVVGVVRYMRQHEEPQSLAAWQADKQLLLLDTIQDPGNLGTILRSAAAMGFFGIILYDCADLYHTKTLRASMGAVFRVSVYRSASPVEDIACLRESGRRVLAASLGQVSYTLGAYTPRKSDCLIVGNEGHGIREELLASCDATVKIPMAEGSESLNAAAAASILLWEYHRNFI